MRCINLKHPNSVFLKQYQRQLFATLTGVLVALSHGIAIGWTSPMIYKLQSEDSPLIFRISIEETSWIGSLSNAGGVTGIIFLGFLIDRLGSKICLYILALPNMIRSLGSTLCQTLSQLLSFAALKMFPILMADIGLSGVMWIFAGGSAVGFLFFLFCVEETKGKSLDNNEAFD